VTSIAVPAGTRPEMPGEVAPPAIHKDGPEIIFADQPFEGSTNPAGSDPGEVGLSITPDDEVIIAGHDD
jgi:hypothetical protein